MLCDDQFFFPSCHSFTVTSTHCVIHIAITSGSEAPLCTIEEGIAVFVCLLLVCPRFAKNNLPQRTLRSLLMQHRLPLGPSSRVREKYKKEPV